MVGCTIHFIDAGIDTGKLIAHVSPDVSSGDDELTLFWRAIKDSAETYAELFDRMALGESFGQHQPGKGTLYQVKDRGLRHERELDRRLPPPECSTASRCRSASPGSWSLPNAPCHHRTHPRRMRDIAVTLAVSRSRCRSS